MLKKTFEKHVIHKRFIKYLKKYCSEIIKKNIMYNVLKTSNKTQFEIEYNM